MNRPNIASVTTSFFSPGYQNNILGPTQEHHSKLFILKGVYMNENTEFLLTAPCGLDCGSCEMHENNITSELAEVMAKKFNRASDEISCKGCRSEGGCKLFPAGCKTLECVENNGVDFCFTCNDFPCFKLLPARDGAERFPHNYKLFNLCRIQKTGLEQWRKESEDIHRRYFKGTFFPGLGPTIENAAPQSKKESA